MEKVTLVYTTDSHGHVTSDSYFTKGKSEYGLAHVAEKIAEIRKEGQELIYFDNGDAISGSLLSIRCAEDLRLANPMVTVLNELDCSFAVIGNHEFDFGLKYLEKVIDQSKFPWLAGNIQKKSSNQAYFGASHLIHETAKGNRIAFIGATTPETAELAYAEDTKQMKIVSPLDVLARQIKEVRAKDADFIVVCYHGGYDKGLNYWQHQSNEEGLESEITAAFPEIDLFVTGHTHGRISNVEVDGVHTIQAGCNGMYLGRIDLHFKDEKDLFEQDKNYSLKSKLVSMTNVGLNEKIMSVTAKAVASTEEWLEEVIAESLDSFTVKSSTDPFVKPNRLISLIHDVIRDYSGCDITVAHYWDMTGWPKGPVTRRQLLNLLPENYIHTLKISGADMKAALERTAQFFSLSEDERCLISTKFYDYDLWSGVSYSVDISKPFGERIINLVYNGEPIDLDERYQVAFFHFRTGGALGYGMLSNYRATWKSEHTIREYLFKYLEHNPQLKTPVEYNWKVMKEDILVEEAFYE